MQNIIYVSSHDLRSPLVNIQGFTSELAIGYKTIVESLKKVDIPDTEKHQIQEVLLNDIPTALRYITSSVRKMDLLLDGLLKLSRIGRQELKPKKINMNSMVKEIVRTLKFKINESNADVIIENLPGCYADPAQINQVFTNIIDNAVKYLDPDRPGQITVSGTSANGQATYSISDNGIGMDPKYTNQIFDLFHRLDPNSPVQGQGLGLSIVNTIIERHNGRITLESQPDRGTTFTITLKSHKN
jgi:signal transduction histidine kinase